MFLSRTGYLASAVPVICLCGRHLDAKVPHQRKLLSFDPIHLTSEGEGHSKMTLIYGQPHTESNSPPNIIQDIFSSDMELKAA